MNKKVKKIFISMFLMVFFVFSLSFSHIKAVSNLDLPDGNHIVSAKRTRIVPGVVENEVIYNTKDGKNPVLGFLVDINLGSNVGIMAATRNYNETGTQTVRQMARAAEAKTGRNIVAAINADLNWNGTGISSGPTIVDGKIISDRSAPFFGILKDGRAIIANGNEYPKYRDDLEQAITARMGWLVKDGEIVNSDKTLHPRTAVGIKADGTVFFYVVDGRGYPRSVGIGLGDMARIMKSYGAVNAINLDGGGSTTYLAKTEGMSELELRNIPSDGVERASISSLLVYADVGDGLFNHANITTENDIYTPNSEVQFFARGVDSAGGFAELPKNLKWNLVDNSYGKILDNGKFISNGKEGIVEVYLTDELGRNVGNGLVEIRKPNEIEFRSNEFSLGFDEESDFGLRLLYNQREVAFKDGDVIWDYDEALGTFNNNIFKSNSENTTSGIVRATIDGTDISAEFELVVGKLPIVIFDFEDDNINKFWEPSSVNGGKSDISIVHKDSGEPVRYGDKSLRLDFDFSESLRHPSGAYAGFSDVEGLAEQGVTLQLPGSPVSVGMWLYATEEAQGLWMRSGIGVNGKTNWTAFNFTEEATGIDWIGWKYVEFDLTDHSGPYTILKGQFIRLMITANSFGGNTSIKPTGSVYIDNITVSYGTNPEDYQAPIVDYIKVNDKELKNNDVFESNQISIETAFKEFEDKYATGIDYQNVNIYIDGVNYKDSNGYELDITNGVAYLQNVVLADGIHEIKVVVIDNAGNEAVLKKYIEIKTNTNNKVYLKRTKNAIIGKEYVIEMKADEIENIKSFDVSMQLSNYLSDYEIIFANNVQGQVEFLNGVRILNIKGIVENDTDIQNDYLFKIVFYIDEALNENNSILHNVIRGTYETFVEKDTLNSFSDLPVNMMVSAPLNIDSNIILVNDDAILIVKDTLNNVVENAEIFMLMPNGSTESLGFTDSKGQLITTEITNQANFVSLIAKKDGDTSFIYNTQVINSFGEVDGTPYNIVLNGVEEAHENKNISWFSNAYAQNQAYIEYSLKSEYLKKGDAAFSRVKGTSNLHAFTGSTDVNKNFAVNVNNVTLKNLLSGEEYVYRVGNGEVWSDLRTFKNVYKYSDVNFIVMGDVQTENFEQFYNNIEKILNGSIKYDFMLQTGDMVDDANRFDQWNGTLQALSGTSLSEIDIVHVLGNHEFYGDPQGFKSKEIYNFPNNNDYYSVQYGSVYIGVISYTMNKEKLTNALEWLVEDANSSNAKWKVLATHQPPYFTNPQGGSELFNEMVPAYAEKAGIDVVFSGHDHSYARTKPLINNQVDKNGVTYIISGAFGEKGYSVVNNPDFNFEIVNDDFDSVYLSIEAKENTFTILAFDSKTGELIDEYEISKELDYEHDHVYYLEGNRIVCHECFYSRDLHGYTGFVYTYDGHKKYHMYDEFYIGLLGLDRDIYYFDENGNALTGNSVVWGLETEFDSEGKFLSGGTGFAEQDGEIYYFENLSIFKGREFVEINGKYYYFSRLYHYVRRGVYNANHVGGVHYFDEFTGEAYSGEKYFKGIKSTFTERGKLISGGTGFVYENGYLYYYEKLEISKKGWFIIDGETYYARTSTGNIITGQYNGFIFDDYGRLIRGMFIKDSKGTRYYMGAIEDKYMQRGFQEIDGHIYYFDENGYMLVGSMYINNTLIKTDKDGRIIFDS